MAELLSERQLKELKEIFELCDADRDGKITTRELGTIMRCLGQNPTEIELQEIVNEVDLNGDGKIDFREYIRMFTRKMKDTDLDEELKETFNLMDMDSNGLINQQDLRGLVTKLGVTFSKEELEDMIKEGDADCDKQLSYDEYIRIMMSK